MRRLALALVAVPVLSGTFAHAADVVAASDALGAGTDDVATCTVGAAPAVGYVTDGASVTSIELSGMGACVGGSVTATVLDAAGSVVSAGSATVVGTGTAAIPVNVSIERARDVRFAVTGPWRP